MTVVTFRVSAPTSHSLTVLLTGNCPELGDWSPNSAVPLSLPSTSDHGGNDIWSCEVPISAPSIEYRFLLGCVLMTSSDPASTDSVVAVQSWESWKTPRRLDLVEGAVDAGVAVFGEVKGQKPSIDRGWLTGQSEICLRFHAKSMHLFDSTLAARCRIRCMTVDLRPPVTNADVSAMSDNCHIVSPVYVSTLAENRTYLQPDDGISFDSNVDHLTFRVQTCSIRSVAFKFALCVDQQKVAFAELPDIGVAFWCPGAACRAEIASLPILSSLKQNVVGMLTVDALVVNSIKNCPQELNFSPRRWSPPDRSLHIGHRGMGSSYINGVATGRVRENTVRSFTEAVRHGADMVELDVMLTQDQVPVIFHDFNACMNVISTSSQQVSRVNVPVSTLTFAELSALNVSKTCDPLPPVGTFPNKDESSFPTLRQCLEEIDPKIGFDVEVKYGMHLRSTGQYEDGLQYFMERNAYIDIILREVFQYAGDRQIILSCFDPDVCTMMRTKQTRFPVVFLSQGETPRYETFMDPRSTSIAIALQFALAESLTGIALHATELLNDLALVARARTQGLAVFSWGEDNNNVQNLKLQREHLVDGLIYDGLDELRASISEE